MTQAASLDPIPLGGFVDAWARRKWIMAQALGIHPKMTLLVLEAHADIQTGRVIGPSGPRFTLHDLGLLGSMGHSVLSSAIRHLEISGYLRVIRHRNKGFASEYFLTHPIRETDTPIRETDTPIRETDTPIRETDEPHPRDGYEVSPEVSPYFTPLLPRSGEELKNNPFSTTEEYQKVIEENIRRFEEEHDGKTNSDG